jgi:hypothetical protein
MIKTFFGRFICVLLCGLSTFSLSAITYYISPSGNDNANGTSASTPWKSISKINSMNVAPGTVILFQGGSTFSGGIYFDQSDANDATNVVTLGSYGTGKAIISSGIAAGFYAYNTKGFVITDLIFQGAGMSANATNGVLLYTDLPGNIKLGGITIKNTEIYNYGKTGLSIGSNNGNTGYKDLLIDNVHVHDVKENGISTWGYTSQSHVGYAHENISVKKSRVNNVPGYADPNQHKGSGIILGQVNKGLIENTAAHNNGAANTHCGGPGGIWVWDANNVTVQYCESYSNSGGTGCDGLGFDLDGGVTNSILQYNYSHDNDGAGYLLGQYDYARPWSNNVVRYNISENDGKTNAGGITLFKGAGTVMNGVKIYNNTVYTSPAPANPGPAAFKIMAWNTGITGAEIYNNIFQTTGGIPLIDIPAGYNAYFAGNMYWTTGGAFKIKYQGTTHSSLQSWRTATGNEVSGSVSTGLNADPKLMNAGLGITVYPNLSSQLNAYKLAANSPAINAGLNLTQKFGINIGATDFFKNVSLAGTAGDIGAHEAPVNITTGIGDEPGQSLANISVFPNPLKSGESLHISGPEEPYSVEVIGINGALIWKKEDIENRDFQIPALNVAAAVYLISIRTRSGQREVKKIVVQ